jgi:hypothetical protein
MLPGHHVHPEFGYFCPSPGMRRVIRVVVAISAFGLIACIGSVGSIGSLMADHDAGLDRVSASTRAWSVGPERAPETAPLAKAAAPTAIETDVARTISVKAGKSDMIGSAAPVAARFAPIAFDAAKPSVKSESVTTVGPKGSCEQDTWARLDGKCDAGKMRKVQVVRNATEMTPVPVQKARKTSAASRRIAPPSAAPGVQPISPPNPATVAAANTVAPQTQETVAPVIAAPKKPQMASGSQHRRRDPSASHPQASRVVGAEPVRAQDAVSSPAFSQGPFVGWFGGMFAR